MVYELWDMETNNLMASYDDEQRALKAVYDALLRGGERAVDGVALIQEDSLGNSSFIASGGALAERARAMPRGRATA